MSPNRVFVIAEAGVNHNGRLDLALALIDAAASAGADAVKFQTFRAEELAAPSAATAPYQQEHTGETDQVTMLRKLELSNAQFEALARHCLERGIEFMSTPFSETAIDQLVALGVKRLKISSGEITNRSLIEKAAHARLPILLSTGMATLDEVSRAVKWILSIWEIRGTPQPAPAVDAPLVLLHCTSAYPAPDSTLNLRAMSTIQAETGLPVGYSDHSIGISAALAATSLGARVVEKHITLDRCLPGPDHAASSEPAEFAAMVNEIRRIQVMLGSGRKEPHTDEIAMRRIARRSVVLAHDLPAGSRLSREHLLLRRPETGISAADLDAVIGRRIRSALPAFAVLQWNMLE